MQSQVFILLCLSARVVELFLTIIFISEPVELVHLIVLPSSLKRAGLYQHSSADAQPEEEAGKCVLMRNELQRVIAALPPQLWMLRHNKFVVTINSFSQFTQLIELVSGSVKPRRTGECMHVSLHTSPAYQKLLSGLEGRSKTSNMKAAGERVSGKLYYVIIATGSFLEVKLF